MILVIALFLMAGPAHTVGSPPMEWFAGYNAPSGAGSHVHEGLQTSDGGYIAIGHTLKKNPDMVVIKVDANGNLNWKKTIGTRGKPDVGYCIAEVSDGFICAGGLYSSGQKPGLVKLDKSTGNIQSGWPKFYVGSLNCGIRGIDVLDDGSIVATGYINCSESGFVFIVEEGTGFIMKTDSNGNQQWNKTLSVPQGTKVRQDSGGFALCSTAVFFNGRDNMDAVLIKTDSSGKEINTYHFGGAKSEHCYDFDLTSDGGYILAGHTLSYGVANWDFYMVKVNSNGSEQWHKTFGQPRGYKAKYIHDEAYGVRQTPDGGYAMVGGTGDEYSYSDTRSSFESSDIWMTYMVKTDANGILEWEGLYPRSTTPGNLPGAAGEYLGLTSDGGYIIFTDTDAFWGTIGSEAMGFMKIAPFTDQPGNDTDDDTDGGK